MRRGPTQGATCTVHDTRQQRKECLVMRRPVRLSVLLVFVVGFLLPGWPAWTQQFDLGGSDQPPDFFGTGAGTAEPVTVAAEFTAPTDGKPAGLFISATIQPGWHIY